jgi:Cu2+-exporting ATPase
MVEGMRCASCAFLIERTLNALQEVSARMNLTTRRLTVQWAGNAERGNDLVNKIAALGYRLRPFNAAALENSEQREVKFLLCCLAVAGFAAGNIMLISVALWSSTQESMGTATRDLLHLVSGCIAIPTVAYAGRPFYQSAWEALRHKRTNMDVPIAVALTLTTVMSVFEVAQHGAYAYFDSVVMLVFLLLAGRYLDRRARGRARAAAQDLLALMSGTATIIDHGRTTLLPISSLRPDMVLMVAAGERIAADGTVATGTSELDPSLMTGETITMPVQPGDRVLAGMVNVLAPMTITVTATPEQSQLGEIIRLMEEAEQGQAEYVRLADRIARYYTPVVHVLALGTFLAWWGVVGAPWQVALLTAMTVLIITCPCALGLAVPVVQVLASSSLFRRGMLLKAADALERLAKVDTIVFDKTGTLTLGHPALINADALSPADMQLAARLATHSRHPLARAIAVHTAPDSTVLNIVELPGCGMEATIDGQTVRLGKRSWCGSADAPADDHPELWLRYGDAAPVRFAFADAVRDDAAAVIADLKQQGFAITLLSGDREPVVREVAAQMGITDWHAGMIPADKGQAITALRQQGRQVLMVGDGLNDALALTAANVSIAPTTALDIAQNAADLVFQGALLKPVVTALQVARRTQSLVRQNFLLAFVYNLCAVPLAMLGHVTPLVAAIAMASSSILVVANAQRVQRLGSATE